MGRLGRLAVTLSAAVALAGCGLFDSGIEWEDGPFVVIWIDLFEQAHLAHRIDKTTSSSVTEPCVTAVGSNAAVVVAERIPPGSRVSEFYVVYKSRFEWSKPESAWMTGPLSAPAYAALKAREPMPELNVVVPRAVCEGAA
ncbi:hypothetical protein PAGU2595_026500 [Lysobacter xanthus]